MAGNSVIPNAAPGQSQYSFFNSNSFTPKWDPNAGAGAGVVNKALGMNPFLGGAGGVNPQAWAKSNFGFSDSYPDINNQSTIDTTNKWMKYQQAGLGNQLDQYSKQMANAGVANSRGGMGVQGGMDLYAAIRQQQMGQQAGMYNQNLNQAMEWQRQKALYDQQNANSLADLYGNMYSSTMGAGANMYGTDANMQKSINDQLLQYLGMKQGAWNNDTQWNRDDWQRRNQQAAFDLEMKKGNQAYDQNAWENAQKKQDKQISDYYQNKVQDDYNRDLMFPNWGNTPYGFGFGRKQWDALLAETQNGPIYQGVSDRFKKNFNTNSNSSSSDVFQTNVGIGRK